MTTDDVEALWLRVLDRLQEAVPSSQLAYLKSARLAYDSRGALQLEVPDRFARDSLRKYKLEDRIQLALGEEGETRVPRLVVRKRPRPRAEDPDQGTLRFEAPTPSAPPPPPEPPGVASFPLSRLNPKYTLESFIVGGGNKLAYAICEAVAESPGTVYNPVFLYGGVGLGKTHLMQAVGHVILGREPGARVRCVSSEDFLNDYVRAIKERRMEAFRNRHRYLDILMIDDVQFLRGKEGVQEEFFHTFNALYQDGKQIILTSDRSPKQLSDLEERLVSRFESGVVCDIKPPNVETRLAILLRLAERAGLSAAPGALEVLAQRIRSNIRLLEGAFFKVQALCSLQRTQIDSSIVEEVVREYGAGQEERARHVSVPLIQELVGEYYAVSVDDLKGSRRTRPIVVPRQIAMFLSHELTEETLGAIAQAFQKKDHTTVMHACEKIRKRLAEDSELEQAVEVLRGRIRSSVED